jgi:hypothetical protein
MPQEWSRPNHHFDVSISMRSPSISIHPRGRRSIEAARVLADPAAAAVERGGLLVRRELTAQTQVETQALLVGFQTAARCAAVPPRCR